MKNNTAANPAEAPTGTTHLRQLGGGGGAGAGTRPFGGPGRAELVRCEALTSGTCFLAGRLSRASLRPSTGHRPGRHGADAVATQIARDGRPAEAGRDGIVFGHAVPTHVQRGQRGLAPRFKCHEITCPSGPWLARKYISSANRDAPRTE